MAIAACGAIALLALVSSCQSQASTTLQLPTARYKVGLAANRTDLPDSQIVYDAFVKSAQGLGMDVEVAGSINDPDEQVRQIDRFVGNRVDAIVIDPAGDWDVPGEAVKRAAAAGIKIVGLDEFLDYEAMKVLAYDATAEEGRQSADFIGKQLGGHGTVLLAGTVQTRSNELRFAAATSWLATKYPGITVAERRNVNHGNILQSDAQGGRTLALQLLSDHPDADAIWCVNDAVAAGVGAGVLETGKHVLVTGIGGTDEGMEYLRAGEISAIWDARPRTLAAAAARATRDLLDGNIPEWQLPKRVMVEPGQYTRSDAGQWAPD